MKYKFYYGEYPINVMKCDDLYIFNLCLPEQEHELVDEADTLILKLKFKNLWYERIDTDEI